MEYISHIKKLSLLLLLVTPLKAEITTYSFSEKNAKDQIGFRSKATVEDFDGKATQLNGAMTIDPENPALSLTATINVPVQSMTTELEMRDKHMKSSEWLDAEKFPGIQFTLLSSKDLSVKKIAPQEWEAKVKGNFELKGQSKEIEVPVKIKIEKEKIFISGSFFVHLSDYGIHGPAALKMIGLKVSNDVQVMLKLVGVLDAGWSKVKKKNSY